MKFLAFLKNPVTLIVAGVVTVGAVTAVVIVNKVKKGKKVEVVEDAKQEAAQ